MASSRSRHRRPVLQPLLEDASHRLLNYAIRRYVFKDAAGHAYTRDVSVVDARSLDGDKDRGKNREKDKDKDTTSRSMPSLSRSHTTGGYGGGHDAAFEHIERFGRSIYDSISGRRQAKQQAAADLERENQRTARHEQRREDERERRRQRRHHHHRDRDDDRTRNVERVERIVGDLHGVSGTLRDMSRRPPGHACDFYEGFVRREGRMQRALGGAIGGLRDVGGGGVSRREGRDRDGRRSDPTRSWDGASRHAGVATSGGSTRHSTTSQHHPTPSDTQSTKTSRRTDPAPTPSTPSTRRRKRRAGASTTTSDGGGLNEGYYGPGNPTYENDPGWRTGEDTRERMHKEHAEEGGKKKRKHKKEDEEGERQGSWERRRPRRGER